MTSRELTSGFDLCSCDHLHGRDACIAVEEKQDALSWK